MIESSVLTLSLLSLKGIGPSRIVKLAKPYNYDLEKFVISLKRNIPDKIEELKSLIPSIKAKIAENKCKGINCITFLDKGFPSKLYEAKDPVIFLFYKGDISLLNSKCLTIIGTREPHDKFIKLGEIASDYFAKKNYTIVSGLAVGCDSIAHKSALKYTGKTIATMPSNLNDILPKSNIPLANSILSKGGLLISEYSVDEPFNKFNYAKRDRIQSLLSNTTLVIESTNTGGTMISVNKSIEDFKTVFALKGNNLYCVKDYIDPTNQEDLSRIEKLIK